MIKPNNYENDITFDMHALESIDFSPSRYGPVLSDLGIVRLDYGFYNDQATSEFKWTEEGRYVIPDGLTDHCHDILNAAFNKIYEGRLPIHYLVKHFRNHSAELFSHLSLSAANTKGGIEEIVFNFQKQPGGEFCLKIKGEGHNSGLKKIPANDFPEDTMPELKFEHEHVKLSEAETALVDDMVLAFRAEGKKIHFKEHEDYKNFIHYQSQFSEYVYDAYKTLGNYNVNNVIIIIAAHRHTYKIELSHVVAIFANDDHFLQGSEGSTSGISYDEIFKFYSIIRSISELKSRAITSDLATRARKSAIKSSKAAIMSRNMSHNLGSHVMAYLKQSLGCVEDIVKSGSLAELVRKDINEDEIIKINARLRDISKIELPFLVGLGKFIRYLQERQDFIATIATDYIPHLVSVNVKDFIYDELNPDYRHERHKERSGYRPHNILLDNIAKSEGLNRSKISIKFRNWDGRKKKHADLDHLRLLNVSLPGGVVGRQAIFSILENVIRNSAKHGRWTDKTMERFLELTIDIHDLMFENGQKDIKKKDRSYFEFLKTNRYLTKDSMENLFVISITDNMTINALEIEKLQKAIAEPYINNAGQMINANKGIKEMRISAAWLLGIDDAEINAGLPPILSVFKSKDNLRYVFALRKTQKVAIVSQSRIVTPQEEFFVTNGWRFFTINEYEETLNKNFELIVVESEDIRSLIFDVSPNRIIVEDLTGICEYLKKDQIHEFENHLWKRFLGERLSDNTIIHIEDEKLYKLAAADQNKNNPLKLCGGKVLVYHNVMDAALHSPHYLYRTHHGDERQLFDFLKASLLSGSYKENYFVEGVSGHNSTDRIIRNEIIDDIWFYKQINTITTKICILDERLFQKLSGLDECDVKAGQKATGLATANLYKGVFVYNLILSGDGVFSLYGFRLPDKKELRKNKSSSAIITCLGEFDLSNKGIRIDFNEQSTETVFSYLSIHQGLLDKVYAIKPNITTQEKIDITDAFCQKLLNNTGRAKLIIHSGRSKPSVDDMPQRVPFVQFAAIENAFDDSKYALTELLDFAQYENNNNNQEPYHQPV